MTRVLSGPMILRLKKCGHSINSSEKPDDLPLKELTDGAAISPA